MRNDLITQLEKQIACKMGQIIDGEWDPAAELTERSQQHKKAASVSLKLEVFALLEQTKPKQGRVWLRHVNFLKMHFSIFQVLNID